MCKVSGMRVIARAEMVPEMVPPTICSEVTSAKTEPSTPGGQSCPIMTQIGMETSCPTTTFTCTPPQYPESAAALE